MTATHQTLCTVILPTSGTGVSITVQKAEGKIDSKFGRFSEIFKFFGLKVPIKYVLASRRGITFCSSIDPLKSVRARFGACPEAKARTFAIYKTDSAKFSLLWVPRVKYNGDVIDYQICCVCRF